MIERKILVDYLDQFLQVNTIADYAPNGLQIEGKAEISKIITGVTASQALLDEAIAEKADAVIVHHGYFWKGENPEIIGIKKQRLQTLLKHDINLFAYHLPLDIHPELGNNVELAKLMDWQIKDQFDTGADVPLGLIGQLPKPMTIEQLADQCFEKLGQTPRVINAGEHLVKVVAWCTGAAQDFITQAKFAGADVYITGEVSERTYHEAKELGIHFLACGHHATERFGIKALGEHLQQQFDIDVKFIDIPNPI